MPFKAVYILNTAQVEIFSITYYQPAQNQPKSHILFHKNGPLRDLHISIMILIVGLASNLEVLTQLLVNGMVVIPLYGVVNTVEIFLRW